MAATRILPFEEAWGEITAIRSEFVMSRMLGREIDVRERSLHSAGLVSFLGVDYGLQITGTERFGHLLREQETVGEAAGM